MISSPALAAFFITTPSKGIVTDACPSTSITGRWWNEWAAQRIVIDGESHFTDNYNQEYSRDIEPMKGGHGDQYYQWMKQYVSAYKNLEECPILVDEGYESQAADEALRKYNSLIQE